MITTVDEGLLIYKAELHLFWQGIKPKYDQWGPNFAKMLGPFEEFPIQEQLKVLRGMERALGLTDEEVKKIGAEFEVKWF